MTLRERENRYTGTRHEPCFCISEKDKNQNRNVDEYFELTRWHASTDREVLTLQRLWQLQTQGKTLHLQDT